MDVQYFASLVLPGFFLLVALFLHHTITRAVVLTACLGYIVDNILYLYNYGSRRQQVQLNDNGYWAVITGASSGLGWSMSVELAKRGYNTILVARTFKSLEKLSIELEKNYHVKTLVIVKDLSTPNAAKELFGHIKEKVDLNAVDVVVNNAGIASLGSFYEDDENKIQTMVNLNIMGVVQLCRQFLPVMVKNNRGKILNVSSMGGRGFHPYQAVYSASKAFVTSFTQGLAYEHRRSGLTISCLCPGVCETNFESTGNCADSFIFKWKIFKYSSYFVANHAIDRLMNGDVVIVPGLFARCSYFICYSVLPSNYTTLVNAVMWYNKKGF